MWITVFNICGQRKQQGDLQAIATESCPVRRSPSVDNPNEGRVIDIINSYLYSSSFLFKI